MEGENDFSVSTKIFTMVQISLSNPFPPAHSESPCKKQPDSVRAKEQKALILYCLLFFPSAARAIWQGWAPSHGCLQGLHSCPTPAHSTQASIRPAVFITALGCPTSCAPCFSLQHCAPGCAAPCPSPSDSGSESHWKAPVELAVLWLLVWGL